MHPFHKSSFRPPLVLGAEREPMLLLVLVCLSVAVPALNLVAFIVVVLLWSVGQFLLVWMATVDPQLVLVFRRNRRYPGYIPAHTTPFRNPDRWW